MLVVLLANNEKSAAESDQLVFSLVLRIPKQCFTALSSYCGSGFQEKRNRWTFFMEVYFNDSYRENGKHLVGFRYTNSFIAFSLCARSG